MSEVPAHRPHGAPVDAGAGGTGGPRRSLVLAGGGMRVAWQSGVVLALLEAGLTFAHGDGTSGGIFTLAMLLSGLSPEEMCERWATIDVRDFSSLMPIAEYLKGPTNLMALGDADGMVRKVYPHLGIDVARIRAAEGMDGTFNVCDFGAKTCVAVPHTDIDVELLVAGMSLPIFLPPVEHRGRTWTDAVWIKDANITEAVRREAEELWLAWCIGNTGRYGAGPLEQYVHMIEMSANGALFIELAQVTELNRRRAAGEPVGGHTRPIRLHVIKPVYPLPLDPDFYLGRISAHTLVAMGYRDARRYIDTATPEGVSLDPTATAMVDPPPGARWTEHLRGGLAPPARSGGDSDSVEVDLELGVEVHDLAALSDDSSTPADLVGSLRHPAWGRVFVAAGTFAIVSVGTDATEVRYRGTFRVEGRDRLLVGTKRIHDDPGFDLWSDLTTVAVAVHDGPSEDDPVLLVGRLRAGVADLRRTVGSLEPTGVHDLSDRAHVVSTVGRLLLGELWERYA